MHVVLSDSFPNGFFLGEVEDSSDRGAITLADAVYVDVGEMKPWACRLAIRDAHACGPPAGVAVLAPPTTIAVVRASAMFEVAGDAESKWMTFLGIT